MIRLDAIEDGVLALPFRVGFKHASAERHAMQSLWVEARAGSLQGFGEGCPREYVTAESLESAKRFVARHREEWIDRLRDVASLEAWTDGHRLEIDSHPAAFCALEIAMLDLLGKDAGVPVERLLRHEPPAGSFRYTAVMGDASPEAFEAQLAHYLKAGFRDFKVKLSGDRERDAAKVRAFTRQGIDPRSVRADANNLWKTAEAAIAHLAALEFPFFALEEPLAPRDLEGMREVARALDALVILDESALRRADLEPLREDAFRWIVNVRVSKMGGIRRALECVRRARELGLLVVVGAHVGESSVLTRAALAVAQSARDILVAQEGAFGTHLLQRDVVESPIMFGAAGVLEAGERFQAPGLGLAVREGMPRPA